MLEDLGLQRPQCRPRLEAELLCQVNPGALVDLKRLRLASAPVLGDHQLSSDPLAPEMPEHQRIELADQLVMSPQAEVGIDSRLQRRSAAARRAAGSPPGRSPRTRPRRAAARATARARRSTARRRERAARSRARSWPVSSTPRIHRCRVRPTRPTADTRRRRSEASPRRRPAAERAPCGAWRSPSAGGCRLPSDLTPRPRPTARRWRQPGCRAAAGTPADPAGAARRAGACARRSMPRSAPGSGSSAILFSLGWQR